LGSENLFLKMSPLGMAGLVDINSDSRLTLTAQMDKLLLASKDTVERFEKMCLAAGQDVAAWR
jgi:hypothetical protein